MGVWVVCSDPTLDPDKSADLWWGLGNFEKDPQVTLMGIWGWEPQAYGKLWPYSVLIYDYHFVNIYWTLIYMMENDKVSKKWFLTSSRDRSYIQTFKQKAGV